MLAVSIVSVSLLLSSRSASFELAVAVEVPEVAEETERFLYAFLDRWLGRLVTALHHNWML